MLKVNADELPWEEYISPSGKFRGKYKQISLALCPYHDHATQWELFYILSGTGSVRSSGETHRVRSGDVVVHPPGDAHQILNDGDIDLTYILVADNPPLDVSRYPDSNKVGVFDDHGRRELFRATEVDYFDGEE